MRSPSELEVVDKASGDLRAIIGDDKGVSKSSSDSGLVKGLVSIVEAAAAADAPAAVLEATFTVALAVVGITVASTEAVEVGINGALICEDALSSEASELVSDRVGLPPTFSL